MPIAPHPRRKVIRALQRAYGWTYDREGSKHTVYVKDGHPESIAVPRHDTITPVVLKNIARILGVKIGEFVKTMSQC